jgi:peptidoglycan/LPS O-acetylase OafA/YrhL
LYIWHFLPSPMLASWTIPGLERFPVMLAEFIRLAVLLAAFTLLSVMSYHLFETHFLRMKSRFAYRTRAASDVRYSVAK